MEELALFVQEIDNLCCIIEEGASVHELYTLGKQFVNRANELLSYSLDNLDELALERTINDGNSLRIELGEMYQLNLRMKQLKWYKRAHGLRKGNLKLRYEDIKSLLHIAAAEVPPRDILITREIKKLQEIGASIEAWENQANKYFNCTLQRYELTEIEQFLKTAADIDGQLPSYNMLKDALNKAREWLRSVEELQASDHFPYCHVLEAIVLRGRNIPIQLEELVRMQGHLNSAQEWKESAENAFLKKNTFYSLLEVLMPRSESVTIDTEKKKPFQGDFVKEMNPAQIVDSFKTAEEKEICDMRKLRRQNLAKNPSNNVFCLCKSSFHGIMYNCHLCYDWFHDNCVAAISSSLPLEVSNKNVQQNIITSSDNKIGNDLHLELGGSQNIVYSKWLCPSCVRSKRPRLETILPLLVSLQTLPIRLPEDEALRCLAERAMNWQERARKALVAPNVADALNIINQEQQQCNNYSKSNTNNFVNISNNNTQPTNGRRKISTSSNATTTATPSEDNMNDSDDDEGRLHIVENNFNETGEDENASINSQYDSRKRLAQIQKLLSESDRQHLDDLMMEGNLMEVSLDEIVEVWRLISCFQPNNNSEAAMLVERYKQANSNKRQNQILQNSATSNLNFSLDDSNDSLLTQSSPGSSMSGGGGSSSKGNTSGSMNKRRYLDTASTGSIPRKKLASSSQTGNKYSGASGNISTSTPVLGNKKYTKRTDLSKQNVEDFSADNVTNHGPQQQMNNSSQNSQKRQKKRTGNSNNSSNNNSNGTPSGGHKKGHQARLQVAQDDDEEECRAENCHKPTGREVDWVQCDGGCNEWFHMYCVGLNRNQIKADDDYICLRCSKDLNATTVSETNSTTATTNSNSNAAPGLSNATTTPATSESPASLTNSSDHQQEKSAGAGGGGGGGGKAQLSR